jgi:hypothetical protein
MRLKRILALGSGIALAGAALSVGSSTAADAPGVGTSKLETTVLSVDLGTDGKLLKLRLLGDEAFATIDGKSEGVVRLSPFSVGSSVAGLNVAPAPVEARSSGAPATAPGKSVKFSDSGVPAAVAGGAVSLKPLSAAVDAAGAHAGAGAGVQGLSLAGGLINVGELLADIGANAGPAGSDGTRTIVLKDLVVLDLGSLLQGVNLPVGQLPLQTVEDITKTLQITIPGLPGLPGAGDLTNAVTGLESQIDGLIGIVEGTSGVKLSKSTLLDGVTPVVGGAETAVGTITTTDPGTVASNPTGTVETVVDGSAPLVDAVQDTLNNTVDTVLSPGTVLDGLTDEAEKLLGNTGLPTDPTVKDVLSKITELKTTLTTLLGTSLKAIDTAPLLSLDSLTLTINTKAGKALEESAAIVDAKIGALQVGDLASLPATDVLGLGNVINSTIGGVLAKIHPGLADMVSVKLLEQTKDVTSENGYNTALASITAVTATVKPPAQLGAILDQLRATTGVGDVLKTVDATVSGGLDTTMSTLTGLLGGTPVGALRKAAVTDALAALAQGATIRIGQVTSSSTFAPRTVNAPAPEQSVNAPAPSSGTPSTGAPAPTTGSPSRPAAPAELPRTGSEAPVLLALAALLIALGLGAPQWAEAAVRKTRG